MSIVIEDPKKIGRSRTRLPIGTFAAQLPHRISAHSVPWTVFLQDISETSPRQM
jgi:hypothetical protein